MRIGVPKEIKNHEYRVGLTPSSVRELVAHGHQIMVETHAGYGIGIDDSVYEDAGAQILSNAGALYAESEMIVKVKEPQPEELDFLQPGQILFSYLHLAPDLEQTKGLIKSKCVAIAYETVTGIYGDLPLLTPMSEVAGRLSIQAGARCLEKSMGGRGVLLGGVPGVAPANVVVLGGGVVGTNAIRMAMGLESHVTVLDRSLKRLRELDAHFGPKLNTLYAIQDNIDHCIQTADLVIGAVLVPGAAAPRLLSRKHLSLMQPGSVLVDVAIDQGGCFETSRPTTHTEPTYIEDGIVHYCVTNMPGAVPRSSTFALNNATLPYVIEIANKGYRKALRENAYLAEGLNVDNGHVTYKAVAQTLGFDYVPVEDVLLA